MTMSRRVLRIGLACSLLALLVLPSVAMASTKVEISPYYGYRFGGEFESGDDFFFNNFGLEINDGSSYGLTVGFNVSSNSQIELLYSHQETSLLEDASFLDNGFPLFDLDVDYLHVGYLYEWKAGQVRPFIVGSLGITRFAPDTSVLDDDERFSVGLGGGVKVMFSDNFGLRFELRGFSTLIDQDDDVFCDSRDFCYSYGDEDYLVQGEAKAGLVLAF